MSPLVEEFKLLESSRNGSAKSIGVNVKDGEVSEKTELRWKVTDDIGVVEVDSGHHSIGGVEQRGCTKYAAVGTNVSVGPIGGEVKWVGKYGGVPCL
ncbi:hypothetical protein L6452_19780 [Arctium lappa]|uniref:Uncharacterized protein n=1 Tax=Arctium lappa TaxID=4217 RepID=A0ACB9B9L2_ARCLA|nr:hypothetical protein L6452_19780 [Arctium lappa]